MRRVGYEEFFPDVLPYVPDCPDITALAAIRDACVEFCDRSHYLQETLERDDIEAGEAEYTLACTPGYTVVMALNAVYKKKTLLNTTHEFLSGMFGSNWREREGEPRYFLQEKPGSIIFSPTPDEDVSEGWYATVVLKPSRDSKLIDERVLENWHEAIGFGARARIHAIPNQPFFDQISADKFRSWFIAKCNEARIQTRQGVGRAPLRVKFKPFGV